METSVGGMIEEIIKPIDIFEAMKFENRNELFPMLVRNGLRTMTLWEAMKKANEITTLSCVPDRYRGKLIHAKNLTTLFTVLIDDVVDKYKDRKLLDKISTVPHEEELGVFLMCEKGETSPLSLARSAWNEIMAFLRTSPQFYQYRDLFLFDIGELIQCQRYNYSINITPSLCNCEEYIAYGTHNFNVKPHMTMDLMFSPDFDDEELSDFRAALHHIQIAVQLVNDVYTIDREINEEVSFGNFATIYTLENDGVEIRDVYDGSAHKVVESFAMKKFEKLWDRHIGQARSLLKNVKSFDVDRFLSSVHKIRGMYEMSSGLM
ncbi:MAG: class 1 isoprenoid biosynthesis enzyme [Methanobacteriota archaeon]|nr:MAG: class 1 isoprenoid biosynthesis enzyme [Euryarchaeota archaeon]